MQFSRRQLSQKASLTTADLTEVLRCRRDHNRLGFAYQLGFVRLHGRFPTQMPQFERNDELVTFTAIQLGIDPSEFDGYAKRRETIAEHQEKIRDYEGLKRWSVDCLPILEAFVLEQACRLEHATRLQAKAREFLRDHGILLPADSTLVRVVGEQREKASQAICQRIAESIPKVLSERLDDLLRVQEGKTVSELQMIKNNPSNPSVEGMLALIRKQEIIEAIGVLDLDLSWLNANYQRALFHYARKASADRIRELGQPRRHATLICFLWQSYHDAVDQSIDMFDKLLVRTQTKALNEVNENLSQRRNTIQTSLQTFQCIAEVLLDDSIHESNIRTFLFDKVVSRNELEECLVLIPELISGKKSHIFQGIMSSYSRLRRFSPALLRTIEVAHDVGQPPGSCFQALQTLKKLNESNRRKLPEGVETGFVPKGLRSFVEKDGTVDRRAWECALLLKFRDEIRSGNVFIRHSKRFTSLDSFFTSEEEWTKHRSSFFERAELPSNPADVPSYLKKRLGEAFDSFLSTAKENTYASVEESGWKLSVDSTDRDPSQQEKLQQLRAWLGRNMRRINLPDLLIEVNNEVGFVRHFLTPFQRESPTTEDICVAIASIMAHGCNIGAVTMSRLTKGISYKQIKRVSDWQFTQEAQRGALAELVGAIAALDTSLYWGEGRTSASDGQRFSMPHKVLQQTYSLQFSDFALEFYSFVADNYAPFYSIPIECTDRDAAVVLDGLLYNENELELEEHYTDTHGYTEINFTAFGMLARRFCPRIRNVKKQRIYRIDSDRAYGSLASLVGRSDRTINTAIISEQWDRMGHFYHSLETGHTTASVALKRLVGYSAKNRFYRANLDLGRILKTEFILKYMSDPELRRRIRRGLLKVEQLHALARDVFYGRRGRINARELWEQMNSCSCLTLIVACIVFWQAREMSRVIRQEEPPEDVDLLLLEHISPIEWDNVVLYGRYVLDRNRIRTKGPKKADKSKPTEQMILLS